MNAAAIAAALSERAEAVCRQYLPHGRRQGTANKSQSCTGPGSPVAVSTGDVQQSHIRGREELEGNVEIRHPRERLRRPAADIASLARGIPYMASRRIAPTTALRASARG